MPSKPPPEFRCQTTFDPVSKIWSGIKATPVHGQDCSTGEAVLEALLKDPEHICQICHDNGNKYTNQEIAMLSVRVAQRFQQLGTPQTEMIGIVGGNTDFLAPLVFGAMLCGLTICPLEAVFKKATIRDMFALTKPSMVFVEGSVYFDIKQCLEDINLKAKMYTLSDHIPGVPEISEFLQSTGSEKLFKPEPLLKGATQIAAVLRSSGTTGTPKAVSITHASLLGTYRPKFDRDEIFLRHLSIHWVSGLSRLVGCCLQGITSVISKKYLSAGKVAQLVEKYGITFIYSSPFLLIDILRLPNIEKFDFSSLRHFHTGGFSFPYSVIERAKKFMPKTDFSWVYGSSELCGAITIGTCNREGHVGQLVPNMEIKIVDEGNKFLGVGEVGEICLRNIHPWQGYFKNDEKTASVYKDGWIYSDDVGHIDEWGNLFVLERKTDIIQVMGQSVYPAELDSIISEIPDVRDVCVCGVSDGEVGQVPAALICKARGSNLTAKQVYEYVAKRVKDYQKLRGGVFFVPVIPKTLTGKRLRQRASDSCEMLRGLKPDLAKL